MSFNCAEIALAVGLARAALPDKVRAVEFVSFPRVTDEVSDVNIGLRLENSKATIVISLQAPWVGLFYVAGGDAPVRAARGLKTRSMPWLGDLISHIQGRTLVTLMAPPGERVVTFELRDENAEDVTFVAELIPARPNWRLQATGRDLRWREPLPRRSSSVTQAKDATQFVPRDFGRGSEPLAWMRAAFSHYQGLREKQLLQSRVQAAVSLLQIRAARLAKARGQMRGALAESAKAEALRVQAETLKGRLHELEPGAKAAIFEGVELDRRFTVAENVSRMFARYKKMQRTQKEVQARMAGVEEASRGVAEAVARVRAFKGDLADFDRLARELGLAPEEPAAGDAGSKRPKPNKEEKKWAALADKGVRRFQSKEGLAIWIGRNHKENEELVVRLARGNDMWVHLKGRPGAHGVIQLPGGRSPSLETLLDAATLVAHYSGVVEKEKAEVDYTQRKHVKRVPGVGGGKFLVTYSQNKTLMLKMEDSRLWRLLKQHS